MAHELRNPLSAMTHAIRVIHDSPDVAREDRELLALVMEEGRRLHRLVDRSVRAGATGPRRAPADVAALIRDTVALLRHDPRVAHAVTFRVRTDPALPRVPLDRDGICQVLWNLLLNAAQAVGRGGHVSVAARADDGALAIEVRDDGPGLPARLRDRVLEPGVSVRSGGAGIGLAVARDIVRAHDGALSLDDAEAGGACARVRLPLGAGPGARLRPDAGSCVHPCPDAGAMARVRSHAPAGKHGPAHKE